MKQKNQILEQKIIETTIEMLETKDQSEIGLREVASKCGISAPSIYTYFKNKEILFERISEEKLEEIKDRMNTKISKLKNSREKIEKALKTYRDWCFENPKTAVVIHTQEQKNTDDDKIKKQNVCKKVIEDLIPDKNSKLYADIALAGLWGCIQSIISKKTNPKFWNQGKKFTDQYIDMILSSIEKQEK